MMKKKILLINPWIYDFAAYDFWNKPLGLLYLASLLRMNNQSVYFINCLDPYHPELPNEPLIRLPRRKSRGDGTYPLETILKPPPLKTIPRNFHRYGITPRIFQKSLESMPQMDLIMITSMMTYWYPGVWDVIGIIRRHYPGVPVVLGGNYVTLCPNHASGSGADYCLSGSVEKFFSGLLKNFLNTEEIFIPDHSSLDSYPYPAFDLIRNLDQIPIMTSRGCPYRCIYCASHLLAPRFQRRDPILVADEIEYWRKNYGVKHFSFYDDALLVESSEMAIPLLKEIIRRNLHVEFHCPNGLHLREITAELGFLLFKAGFRTIRFGFETDDLTKQKSTGGKVYNDDFSAAVHHLKSSGYREEDIGVYILCGLPHQSADEVRRSIRFVQSYGARPYLAEYSPIPGTALWEDAIATSPYPIAEEPLFQNNSILPCRSEDLTFEMYQSLKRMTRHPDHSPPAQ
jgi:radical SAM superfamily enzyme YgiQ (UPF0313 family)